MSVAPTKRISNTWVRSPMACPGPRACRRSTVPSESLAEWALDRVSGPPTASDEAGQNLTFIVTNDNSSLFADQPAMGNYGTLTFTPNVTKFYQITIRDAVNQNTGTYTLTISH